MRRATHRNELHRIGTLGLDSLGLVDRAVEAIRQYILADGFDASGLLSSQGDLARTLGVSRPVIREAMRILQSQGLVEISQGKRPRVKPASTGAVVDSLTTLLQRSSVSMMELVEARIPLESEIAWLAASRRGREDLALLRVNLEEFKKSRDLERCVELDVEFHRLLAKATGNKIFELLLETLAQILKESRRHTLTVSGLQVPIRHHAAIFKAVENGDGPRSRQAMQYHLNMARKDLLKNNLRILKR